MRTFREKLHVQRRGVALTLETIECAWNFPMEIVDGPIDGFFVASYAARVGETGFFIAYAKVCVRQPASYWGADCILKLFVGEEYASMAEALAFASVAARARISRLQTRDLANLGSARLNTSRRRLVPLAFALQPRLL